MEGIFIYGESSSKWRVFIGMELLLRYGGPVSVWRVCLSMEDYNRDEGTDLMWMELLLLGLGSCLCMQGLPPYRGL